MTNKNALDQDPLTNSNASQRLVQGFGQREGGYLQQNLGPINMAKPSQPIIEPIQVSQVSPINTQTVEPLPPIETTQNPFTEQSTTPVPPIINNVPLEGNKPAKKSEDKINIILVLAIFLVIVLIFVVIILVMLNKSNNVKGTDNLALNITQSITKSVLSPTIQSNEADNTIQLAVYDDTRILVTSPLPNQFITKEGVTIVLEGQMKGFFEGTMGYRIVDEFNTKLATGVITADGDNYISFVAFSKQITISPFTDSPATKGNIEFYETSMQDGSINVLATIPLKFQ